MAKLLLNKVALTAVLALFVFYLSAGIAAAGTIEVYVSYGITDADRITLLRGDGGPDSDLVQVIYAGPDGVPNPPGVEGTATGYDRLLELEAMPGQRYTRIGSGFPFDPDEGKFHGDFRLPDNLSANPKIFIRAWNAPTVAESTHYGDSVPRSIKDVAFGESKNFTLLPGDSWSAATEPPPGVGVDTRPPGPVTNFKAVAGDRQVTLTWVNPADDDFDRTLVRRRLGSYPEVPGDGETVVWGNMETRIDRNLSNETTYFYAAFAYDTSLNYAPPARIRATPRAPAAPAPGNGCFIATAAYGTPLAAEVKILSRFRDEYLLGNVWGRRFVAFYYKHSPHWARYIEKRPALKVVIRHSLRPFIWSLRLLTGESEN